MGFFVMLGSAVLGIVLLSSGLARRKEGEKGMAAIILGLVLIAFAVWLAWPK